MGRRYSIVGSQTVASPTDSVLAVTATTAVRPQVYDIIFGSAATPADNALNWLVQRYTAAGAGSSVTPTALDSGDPASTSTSLHNHTTEPTYTTTLLSISANQRSTQRWVAAPGSALIAPATASNGIGLAPVHASFTGDVEATILFEE